MHYPAIKRRTVYIFVLSILLLLTVLYSVFIFRHYYIKSISNKDPCFGAVEYSELVNERAVSLDRGLIAMCSEKGVYLSWRLMCSEDNIFGNAQKNTAFHVFRDDVEIAEVLSSTNYYDPEGSDSSVYSVLPSSGPMSSSVVPFSSGKNYFEIPLIRPSASQFGDYTINDVSTGDLDGDGSMDLVIKWDSSGKDSALPGYTGTVLLDAYRLDGSRIWESPVDLGINIRAGAHYTQALVYDLDGDGCSELVCKTAPGSKDSHGLYVSQASSNDCIRCIDDQADLRNEEGKIIDGDELLTVFNGKTGLAVDTIYYPCQRISSEIWGDNKGNRCDRFTSAIAYLDGLKPYAVFMRGYYLGNNGQQRQTACAVSFDGLFLSCDYCFDTYNPDIYPDKQNSASYHSSGAYKGVNGYSLWNEIFVGEGNHNCVVADIDNDGKDEIITGACCYEINEDNVLSVRWCTFLGHGDAIQIADYDPQHEGYELLVCHEDSGLDMISNVKRDFGVSLIDANSGSIMSHSSSTEDTGRCMLANLGINGYLYEFWGGADGILGEKSGAVYPQAADGSGSFSSVPIPLATTNFRIFWDGDLYDELVDGDADSPLNIYDWNGETMKCIFTTEGCHSINESKANPCLQADLIGDWREELVMAVDGDYALRIFVSPIPTDYKMMTLLHDPVYRLSVAAQQSSYNQPPHIGFYTAPIFFGDIE